MSHQTPQEQREAAARARSGIAARSFRKIQESAGGIRRELDNNRLLRKYVDEVLLAFGLVKDYWTGVYRKVPRWAIVSLVLMFLYLATPIDIVPDFIPLFGLLDDVVVVALFLALLRGQVRRYGAWRHQAHNPAIES